MADHLFELHVTLSPDATLARLQEAIAHAPAIHGERWTLVSRGPDGFELRPPAPGYETPQGSCQLRILPSAGGARLVLEERTMPRTGRRAMIGLGGAVGAVAMLLVGRGGHLGVAAAIGGGVAAAAGIVWVVLTAAGTEASEAARAFLRKAFADAMAAPGGWQQAASPSAG